MSQEMTFGEQPGGLTARAGWVWDPETTGPAPAEVAGGLLRYSFVDGRNVEADSPLALFEALRNSEGLTHVPLGRYLDRVRGRGALGFGLLLDVGGPHEALEARCQRALLSLLEHGWLRPVTAR